MFKNGVTALTLLAFLAEAFEFFIVLKGTMIIIDHFCRSVTFCIMQHIAITQAFIYFFFHVYVHK